MKYLFLICAVVCSSWAFSFVDPENGNNYIEFIDMEPTSKDQGAPYIRRYYNSLTSHQGIFGKGWASDLETRLEFLPGGSLAVIPYGAGRIRVFETTPFNLDPSWKLPVQEDLKNKTIARLKSDKNFRYQWLKENGYSMSSAPKEFTSMTLGTEVLSFKNKQWTFKDSAGESWVFDLQGKLIGMNIPGGGEWQITYQNNLPATLKNTSRIYSLSYNSEQLIQKLEFKKSILQYQYQKQMLQESVDSSAKKYSYAYSAIGQLESIKAVGVDFQYVYQPNTGRVLKASENGDVSEYAYEEKKISDGEVITTTIKDAQGPQKIEYTYLGLASGRYLAKLREIKGQSTTETQFNVSRQPTKILSGHSTQEIVYDQNGRIAEIKKAGETTDRISRDSKSGKITEIRDRNQLRKFSYTPQGKINSVELGDGSKLSFLYNPEGNIQHADLTNLQGLSEGRLTPVYEGGMVKSVLLDGKKATRSEDQLRAVRFYQVIQEATSLPQF